MPQTQALLSMLDYKDITADVLKHIPNKYRKRFKEFEMENLKVYRYSNGECCVDWSGEDYPTDADKWDERWIELPDEKIAEDIESEIEMNYLR